MKLCTKPKRMDETEWKFHNKYSKQPFFFFKINYNSLY
jgi:hypothetical protein